MWFASYLYEQGVISGQQFAEAAKIQLQRRQKFGAIAIRLGKLNVKQVMTVFQAQVDNQDTPFGEIAFQLGFLTRTDIAEILAVQSANVPSFGSILVEMCVITEEQLTEELHRQRESSADALEHQTTGKLAQVITC